MAALHPPYASPDAIPLPNIDSLTDSDAVDKIDAEIARFEDHIRSLRQLRNSVVPVSHFPAEILSKVFLHYHEQDEMDTKRTLTISWVSRQWRSVVLEQPALWSVICVSLPYDEEIVSPSAIEYVQQCLIRSRNAPLAITYAGPRSVVLTMCSSQLHRIRKLHISHYFTADEQLPFIEEWQHPAPLLVDLELVGVGPEGLFGGTYPPLQYLNLDSSDFFWDSPILSLSTLTELEIYQPEEFTTPAEIVTMLRALPALRSCTLHFCFESTQPTSVRADEVRRFPGLKHLSITEEYHDATAELLQRLDIPNASLEVVYQVDDLEMPTEDFLQRFQWFAEFQSRSWKGTCDVSFNCRDTACGDFIAITIHSTPNRWFKFGIEHLSEKFGFDPVICASQYLALEDVQNMCFDQVSLDGLASLGPLYRLKTLELERGARGFVEWAVCSSRELFPSVTQLKVGGVSYLGFEDFINRHGDDEMILSEDDASVDSDSEDSVDISTE